LSTGRPFRLSPGGERGRRDPGGRGPRTDLEAFSAGARSSRPWAGHDGKAGSRRSARTRGSSSRAHNPEGATVAGRLSPRRGEEAGRPDLRRHERQGHRSHGRVALPLARTVILTRIPWPGPRDRTKSAAFGKAPWTTSSSSRISAGPAAGQGSGVRGTPVVAAGFPIPGRGRSRKVVFFPLENAYIWVTARTGK